ncbi:PUA-like domain-containing protein [Earliella scabrosa]|nr:PUA-like domain-containing protein [Earliella scabrosa]
MSPKHWLMKAEPDSRIVKGKDVKFSVDDFESAKTTPWEGVRNAEARNLMKEMVVGDKVLFYHSNCKNPGIAAFAEVSKEAYPDYTAWDTSHPYYDAKTDKEKPKWYMVDVTFVSRAAHCIPLSLLRNIATSSSVPEEVAYIGAEGAQAIKEMALVTRGRLSVQRVEEKTWQVIEQMAERGGWDEAGGTVGKSRAKPKAKGNAAGRQKPHRKPRNGNDDDDGDASEDEDDRQAEGKDETDVTQEKRPSGRKRKAADVEPGTDVKPRRSTRPRR